MRYQPIRYRTVQDILVWTQTFHRALAREFERLSKGPVQERVALLLQYLADHERALAAAVHHFEADAQKELLNTWHDHFPELDMPEDLEQLEAHLESADTTEVLNAALRFHDVLIRLYEEIRNTAPTDEVRDVFDNLLTRECREKERLARDANLLEDI